MSYEIKLPTGLELVGVRKSTEKDFVYSGGWLYKGMVAAYESIIVKPATGYEFKKLPSDTYEAVPIKNKRIRIEFNKPENYESIMDVKYATRTVDWWEFIHFPEMKITEIED